MPNSEAIYSDGPLFVNLGVSQIELTGLSLEAFMGGLASIEAILPAHEALLCSKVLGFWRSSGDIQEMLAEIERGYLADNVQ